eukprot:2938469-Pyramimonas_sp.AAC.1
MHAATLRNLSAVPLSLLTQPFPVPSSVDPACQRLPGPRPGRGDARSIPFAPGAIHAIPTYQGSCCAAGEGCR